MKIAFVDRDGTIIRDYADHEWSRIAQAEFIPGSIDALKTFQNNGFQIIIITNQYLIGEGFISQQQYKQITQSMLDTIAAENIKILDVFYCPHARNSNCFCCKPRPGMIQQALEKHSAIDLEESFIVGDSDCDAGLAAQLDMRFYGIGIKSSHLKARCVNTLLEASSYLA